MASKFGLAIGVLASMALLMASEVDATSCMWEKVCKDGRYWTGKAVRCKDSPEQSYVLCCPRGVENTNLICKTVFVSRNSKEFKKPLFI